MVLINKRLPDSFCVSPGIIDYKNDLIGKNTKYGGGRKRLSENEPPFFSIITVVKDDFVGLKKTIESVILQKYDNYEYIVVDGNSSDGTIDVIKYFDKFIDIYFSEKDNGISDAFNKAISISSGKYIQILNAGDVFFDDSVLVSVEMLCKSNKIVTGFSRYGNSSIPKKKLSNSCSIIKKSMISHQASFVSRDVYEKIGLYNLNCKVRMDYEFWLRALQEYNFYFFESSLVNFNAGESMRRIREFYQEEFYANACHLNYGYINYFYLSVRFVKRSLLRKIKLALCALGLTSYEDVRLGVNNR